MKKKTSENKVGLPEKPKNTNHIPFCLTLKAEIGEGGFGKVFEGIYHNQVVAIKIILNDDQSVLNELNNLEILNHPNIVKLLDYEENREKGEIAIIMERADCSLDKDLAHQTTKSLDNRTLYHLLWDTMNALDYAANKGFYHGDIKPANTLMFSQNSRFIFKPADWRNKSRQRFMNS